MENLTRTPAMRVTKNRAASVGVELFRTRLERVGKLNDGIGICDNIQAACLRNQSVYPLRTNTIYGESWVIKESNVVYGRARHNAAGLIPRIISIHQDLN